MKSHKKDFNLKTLIQYLRQDSDNFYDVIISILENLGDMKNSIIEDVKFEFIKNDIKLNTINICNYESEE